MCERKKKLTQGQQLTEEEIIRKKRILAMEKLSQGNELEAEQAESTLIEQDPSCHQIIEEEKEHLIGASQANPTLDNPNPSSGQVCQQTSVIEILATTPIKQRSDDPILLAPKQKQPKPEGDSDSSCFGARPLKQSPGQSQPVPSEKIAQTPDPKQNTQIEMSSLPSTGKPQEESKSSESGTNASKLEPKKISLEEQSKSAEPNQQQQSLSGEKQQMHAELIEKTNGTAPREQTPKQEPLDKISQERLAQFEILESIFQISTNAKKQQSICISGLMQKLNKKYPEVRGQQCLALADIQQDILPAMLMDKENAYLSGFEEKMSYLFRVIANCLSSPIEVSSDQRFKDLAREIKETATRFLIGVLLYPSVFSQQSGQKELKPLQARQMSHHLLHQQFHKFLDFHFSADPKLVSTVYELMHQISKEHFSKIVRSVCGIQSQSFGQASIQNITPYEKTVRLFQILSQSDATLQYLLEESQEFYTEKIQLHPHIHHIPIMNKLLSYSCFAMESVDWNQYFELDISLQKRNKAQNNINVVRQKFNQITESIYSLLLWVVRKQSLNGKKCIVKFFQNILEQNKDQLQMMHNQPYAAKRGYLVNCVKLLLKFTDSMTQSAESMNEKMKLVDVQRLQEKTDLYQNFDQINQLPDARDVPATKPDVTNWFITELCRLSLFGIKILASVFEHKENLLIQQQRILRMSNSNHGPHPQILKIQSVLISMAPQLDDPDLIQLCTRFLAFYVKIALRENHVSPSLQDVQNEVTKTYQQFPIMLIENIKNVIEHIQHTNIQYLEQTPECFSLLMSFCAVVLNNDRYCFNPHLRSQMITLFSSFLPQKKVHRQQPQYDIFARISISLFSNNAVIEKQLMRGIMQIFILCEKTGSAHQFEEKFNYRQHFCLIFNYTFNCQNRDVYVREFKHFLAKEKNQFLIFANLFFNDIIHCFDVCLQNLKKIKEIESNAPGNLPNEAHQMGMLRYETDIIGQLLQKYLKTMTMISKFAQDALLVEEIRSKMVMNINYIMNNLNNDVAAKLYKVKDMEQILFKPKIVIKYVIRLYINLSKHESFVQEIVRDDRSFSPEVFNNSVTLLRNHQIIKEGEICYFEYFLKQLVSKVNEFKQINKLLEDMHIPEEFLDALISDIMKDPVKLPNSNQVVDRLTIRKHLLNDKTDPFTRSPLEEKDLIEMPELKLKIEKFLEQVAQEYKQGQNKPSQQQALPADTEANKPSPEKQAEEAKDQQSQQATSQIPLQPEKGPQITSTMPVPEESGSKDQAPEEHKKEGSQ